MSLDEETRRELREVLQAAQEARAKLRKADSYLQGARMWGWMDVFGGKMLVSAAKHYHMNKANRLVAEAQDALQVLSLEMRDVSGLADLNLKTTGFAGLTDLLMDNAISDMVILRRIGKSRKQIAAAQRVIDGIVEDVTAALYS